MMLRARRVCLRMGAFLALCLVLCAVPLQGRAAGTTIATFYATTKAAYDAWGAGSNVPAPARVAAFAAGTTTVAYYLAYAGATPNVTTLQIVQRDGQGNVSKGGVHTLHYAQGSFADYFSDRQPAYVAGSYTFDLLLDGVVAATAHFTVAQGLAVPAFFAATKSAIDGWQRGNAGTPPQRTRFFPKGTQNIGYYFSFIGVTPNSTTFHVNIYNAAGALFLAGAKHTLHYAAGYFGNYFYDMTPAFPNGIYTMKITINGKAYKSSVFSIG